jgi:hypothetical protein
MIQVVLSTTLFGGVVEAQDVVRVGRLLLLPPACVTQAVALRSAKTGSYGRVSRQGQFRLTLAVPIDTIVMLVGQRELVRHPVHSAPDTLLLPGVEWNCRAQELPPLAFRERRHSSSTGSPLLEILDSTLVRNLPSAAEPDPFRALGATPNVTLASLLSARPSVRGGDLDATQFMIDGHLVDSPFHVGRFFSAFPAIALAETQVVMPGGRPDALASPAGVVDLIGRQWDSLARPELQYGFGLASFVTGTERGWGNLLVAGRSLAFAPAGLAARLGGLDVTVRDAYARAEVEPIRTRVTAFGALDRASEQDATTTARLDLSSWLIGTTTAIAAGTQGRLTAMTTVTAMRQAGADLPARNGNADVATRVVTASARMEGAVSLHGMPIVLTGHVGVAAQSVRNDVIPVSPQQLPTQSLDATPVRLHAQAGVLADLGRTQINAGAGVERSATASVLRPFLRLVYRPSTAVEVGFSLVRTGALQQVISDAIADPKLEMYDYWRLAGVDGATVLTSTQVAVGASWRRGAAMVALRGYLTGGTGIQELIPVPLIRSGASPGFRVGDSRNLGVQVITSTGSAQISYTIATANRRWDDGWVPSLTDQRHRVTFSALARPAPRTRLGVAVTAGSSFPYTPYASIGADGVRWGPELSARGRWSIRGDVSLMRDITGPFGSEMTLGFSVINLTLGDQSVREPIRRTIRMPDGTVVTGAASQELFRAPPIPSIVVRWAF